MTKSEILQSIQLRQSTIKDFLICTQLFRFKHLEKLQPAFRNPAALHGSILHKLIYLIHRDKWNLNVRHYYRDIFWKLEFDDEPESNIPVRWENREKELSLFEDNAVEILDGYRKKPENRDCVVWYSEQPFQVKIAGHLFTGTIDQIRKNVDGTLELIDFKSGKQMPGRTAIYNDWQLALYSYAAKYGEFDVDGRLYKPRLALEQTSIYSLRAHEIRKRTTSNGPAGSEKSDPLIRLKADKIDFSIFRNQVRNLLKAMLKDWHYPNPNSCSFCQYTGYCLSRSNELPASLVNEANERLEAAALAS